MGKPGPLNILSDLARDDTDAAARELGRLQGVRTQAERQLDALRQYRDEYRARMQATAAQGMSAGRWRDFAAFLASLDDAIRQQTAALARADAELQAGRADWQHHKRRTHAFDTLIARADARQQQVLQRREQRASDEHAARLVRRNATQPS